MGSLNLSSSGKLRPWSFHAATEWNDWDYYQPPSFIHPSPYKSTEELSTGPCDDTVRSLTEFGENYEIWFKTDDGCGALRSSTPVKHSNEGVNSIPSIRFRDASATTEETGSQHVSTKSMSSKPHVRRSLLYNNPGEETDESGKRSSSSGCFLSDEDEDDYEDDFLIRKHQTSSTSNENAIKSPKEDTLMEKSSTMTSCAEVQTNPTEDKKTKKSKKSRYFILCVSFTLVSLFLSLLMSTRLPLHLELEYKRPPPV
jgi:hypothetical protein